MPPDADGLRGAVLDNHAFVHLITSQHSTALLMSLLTRRLARTVWQYCSVPSPTDPRILDLLSSLPDYREQDVFSVSSKLRAEGHDPDIVSSALTQSRLRQQAAAKFGDGAKSMLFTADGLEQASRPDAAQHHANTFLSAGIQTLREVGCGIGADTRAFAQAGLTVYARELDSGRVDIARHNLSAFPNVSVELADGLADISEEGLWADPARRGPNGRINNPEEWAPPLSAVISAARQARVAGIKVAPGIDFSHLPSDTTVEWLSSGGDLVEAIIWLGIGEPARRAVLLDQGTLTVPGDPSRPSEMNDPRELGAYLYEPDPAVIRAGGIARLCDSHDLAPAAPGIAYLTGDTLVDSPFLEGFRVKSVLPMQEKKLARELKGRDIGSLEIKKRGVDITPEALRTRLKLKGTKPATIILTPLLNSRNAVLVDRI